MSFAASAVRALRQAPKVAQRGFRTSKTAASVSVVASPTPSSSVDGLPSHGVPVAEIWRSHEESRLPVRGQ